MTTLTALGATAEAARLSKAAINLLDNRFLALQTPNKAMPPTDSPGALILATKNHRNIKPYSEIAHVRASMKRALSKAKTILHNAAYRGRVLKQLADFIDSKTSGPMPEGVDIGLASAARTIRAAGQSGAIDADQIAGKLRSHADAGTREIFRFKKHVMSKYSDVSALIIARKGRDYMQACAHDCGNPADAEKYKRWGRAFNTVFTKRLAAYKKSYQSQNWGL